MAKRRVVSRTMTNTWVKYLTYDIRSNSGQTKAEEITLFGDWTSREKITRKLRTLFETDFYKIVAVLEFKPLTELFVMDGEDFFHKAKRYPINLNEIKEKEN